MQGPKREPCVFDFIWAFCLIALAGSVAVLHVNHIKWEKEVRWIFCAFLLVFILRSFFWEPYRTEGPSMSPTLPNHSFVVVDKQAYGITIPLFETVFQTSFPKYNDVVAFHHGNNIWIKRVKAQAGDTLVHNYMGWYVNAKWVAPPTVVPLNAEVFERSLPVQSHFSHTDMWKNYRAFSIQIPTGYFFAVGDNPNHSTDSRTVGVIPYKKVVGRVYWRESWLHKE